jgi:hypothetical protein
VIFGRRAGSHRHWCREARSFSSAHHKEAHTQEIAECGYQLFSRCTPVQGRIQFIESVMIRPERVAGSHGQSSSGWTFYGPISQPQLGVIELNCGGGKEEPTTRFPSHAALGNTQSLEEIERSAMVCQMYRRPQVVLVAIRTIS